MKQNTWRGKNILITGAGGFVGSHVADFFLKNGAKVIGLTRNPKLSSEFLSQADVAVKRQVEPFFAGSAPIDVVIHLAGDALVEDGQNGPYETFRNNVLATLNVLDLGRKYNVRRIIVASTVHVYGQAAREARETDPPRPSRPYETSKTCTDLLAQSYADTYGLPVVIPRFSNIYGPGDVNISRLIPKTIRSVLRGEDPVIWGGDAVRDYLFIHDAVSAYVKLASMPDSLVRDHSIFNFGTGEHIVVRALVEKIIELSGRKLSVRTIENQRTGEIPQQYVNWQKAKTVLDWEPKVHLRDGLMRTIEWYKNRSV